jgi:Skp family chaperone for outer membrane proteins
MKSNKFNSKRYIKAIDDLLDLIKGVDTQIKAHRKANPSSELMIEQYSELKNRYQQELQELMSELQQAVQQQLVLAAA